MTRAEMQPQGVTNPESEKAREADVSQNNEGRESEQRDANQKEKGRESQPNKEPSPKTNGSTSR